MTDSDAVVIDPQARARLEEWGGAKLVTQMIKLFLENAPTRVEQVREGLSGGGLEEAERGVHSLKSSAANVGAVVVSRIAAEMEERACERDAAALGALLPDLEAAFAEALEQLTATIAGTEGGRMKKIAVVEDNPDNRLLVQAILDDLYEISEYETGGDAIAGLGDDRPDLILLDISLPGMDGTEVLAWIRDQDDLRETPVIALTAHAMAGDREKYISAGFNDYVTKPIVDEAVLTEAIERWLGQD